METKNPELFFLSDYTKNIFDLIPKNSSTILNFGYNIELLESKFKATPEVNFQKITFTNPNEIETLPFTENYFDCILLFDIIQQIINPDFFLTLITKYLRSEGTIIITVPNILHHSSITQFFIAGRFSGGIATLNSKNLRFFTPIEIIELLNRNGYYVHNEIFGVLTAPNHNVESFFQDLSTLLQTNSTYYCCLSRSSHFVVSATKKGDVILNQSNENFIFQFLNK